MTQSRKKKEITVFLHTHREAIANETMIVLFVDESHLNWSDACGYGWCPTQQRLLSRISNERQRQSYCGALNMQNGTIHVEPYSVMNTQTMVTFITLLREQYAGKQLVLLWDGASYHRSKEVHAYLTMINEGTTEANRCVHCICFAPYAPQQNPIETIWLKAKRFVRQKGWNCSRFSEIKQYFLDSIQNKRVQYKNLHMYI